MASSNFRVRTCALPRLLIKLAQLFELDLQSFTTNADDDTIGNLMEVFGDPLFARSAHRDDCENERTSRRQNPRPVRSGPLLRLNPPDGSA